MHELAREVAVGRIVVASVRAGGVVDLQTDGIDLALEGRVHAEPHRAARVLRGAHEPRALLCDGIDDDHFVMELRRRPIVPEGIERLTPASRPFAAGAIGEETQDEQRTEERRVALHPVARDGRPVPPSAVVAGHARRVRRHVDARSVDLHLQELVGRWSIGQRARRPPAARGRRPRVQGLGQRGVETPIAGERDLGIVRRLRRRGRRAGHRGPARIRRGVDPAEGAALPGRQDGARGVGEPMHHARAGLEAPLGEVLAPSIDVGAGLREDVGAVGHQGSHVGVGQSCVHRPPVGELATQAREADAAPRGDPQTVAAERDSGHGDAREGGVERGRDPVRERARDLASVPQREAAGRADPDRVPGGFEHPHRVRGQAVEQVHDVPAPSIGRAQADARAVGRHPQAAGAILRERGETVARDRARLAADHLQRVGRAVPAHQPSFGGGAPDLSRIDHQRGELARANEGGPRPGWRRGGRRAHHGGEREGGREEDGGSHGSTRPGRSAVATPSKGLPI